MMPIFQTMIMIILLSVIPILIVLAGLTLSIKAQKRRKRKLAARQGTNAQPPPRHSACRCYVKHLDVHAEETLRMVGAKGSEEKQ